MGIRSQAHCLSLTTLVYKKHDKLEGISGQLSPLQGVGGRAAGSTTSHLIRVTEDAERGDT